MKNISGKTFNSQQSQNGSSLFFILATETSLIISTALVCKVFVDSPISNEEIFDLFKTMPCVSLQLLTKSGIWYIWGQLILTLRSQLLQTKLPAWLFTGVCDGMEISKTTLIIQECYS